MSRMRPAIAIALLSLASCAARVRELAPPPTGRSMTEQRLAEFEAQRRRQREARLEAVRWDQRARELAASCAPRLARCLNATAMDEAELLVELEWRVTGDGKVRAVDVVWTNVTADQVLSCVVDDARALVFEPHAGAERRTSYAFALRRP